MGDSKSPHAPDLEHGGLEVPHTPYQMPAPVSGVGRLILASASPRRRELLASLGLEFDVVPSDVDETLEPMALPDAVAALALRKARAVAASRRAGLPLAARTLVAIDGRAPRQPAPPPAPRALPRALRGGA